MAHKFSALPVPELFHLLENRTYELPLDIPSHFRKQLAAFGNKIEQRVLAGIGKEVCLFLEHVHKLQMAAPIIVYDLQN